MLEVTYIEVLDCRRHCSVLAPSYGLCISSVALQLTFIIKNLLLCCEMIVDTAELECESLALVLWVWDSDECWLI